MRAEIRKYLLDVREALDLVTTFAAGRSFAEDESDPMLRMMRRLVPVSSVALLLLSGQVHGAPPIVLERVANRLVLSDGSSIDFVGQLSGGGEAGVYQSAYFRIGGSVYTVAMPTARCGLLELRVSSRKGEILIRADYTFAEDGLPVPQTLTIKDDVYRSFWGEVPVAPEAKRRAVEAVAKLPAEFVAALAAMRALEEQNEEGVPFSLGHLTPYFDEPAPPVFVLDRRPLDQKGTESLAREAGVLREK